MKSIAFSLILAASVAASTSAAAQPIAPVVCAMEKAEEGTSAKVYENFLASMANSEVGLLEDEELSAAMEAQIEACAEAYVDDFDLMARIAFGVLAEHLLREGGARIKQHNFDPKRLDDLFLADFEKLPLDTLAFGSFRPPARLRKPALALRAEMVEKSGLDEVTVTRMFTAYMTGLVGRVASKRAIANAQKSE